MVYRKNTLIKFAALFLTAAAVTPVAQELGVRGSAFAQSFGDNPDNFPIPSSLPDGTTLKVDGSTSMRVTNQALESRFENQYPDIDVELNASRTDEAIAALLNGDIELVASGRPLTEAEKAQGLVEVPLEREKLAFIVGPDNTFEGDLSFEQFAGIFRGEITNWSEVGGPDRPIRLIDRPDYSDTRRALSTYEVFKGQPFEPGSTAEPVADDETQTVMAALGNDGIGYAVYSQVQGLDTVRILPMHQTFPDDPRYPYSQYRAFVYLEDASPAVLAFLGFATAQPGAEVITDAAPDTTTAAGAAVDEAGAAADAADADGATTETIEAPTADTDEAATALVPGDEAATETRGGFPWWLLGIPILGGLLWWLFKGLGGGAPAAAPVAAPIAAVKPEPRLVLTPRNCRDAYAYWEIPSDRLDEAGDRLKVRLYDVTGRAPDAALPPHLAEFDCVGDEPDLHLPIKVDNHDYLAEVGYLTADHRWIPFAKSEPVRVPACPKGEPARPPGTGAALGGATALGGAAVAGAAAVGAAGLAAVAKPTAQSRIILTPRNCHDAYAYWEVPDSRHNELKQQGGETLMVRLYDVTGRLKGTEQPTHIAQFEWVGPEPDLHLPIPTDDRDYRAELGYLTADNRWLPIAKSEAVHVPACPRPSLGKPAEKSPEAVPEARFPGAAIAGAAAVGAAAVGAAAVGAGDRLKGTVTPGVDTSRIVLTPRNDKKAYAYWEVPETAQTRTKAEGGKDYQLRIYDVTDIDLAKQPPHSVLTYDVDEEDCDRFVPLPATDRDYIAEIGYRADDGTWLDLARSLPVKADTVLAPPPNVSPTLGVAGGLGAAAIAGVAGAAATHPAASPGNCAIQTVNVHSRHNAVLLDADQMHYLQTSVSATQAIDTGLYVLKIREGVFNYDGDDTHPGEPFVLLWIYGGKVVNQKTGVPVNATWSTLNGYADTLTLDVREPAQVCAFFMDTFPDDNIGEITLSVIKL